jgi:hypothetical protein
MHGAEIKIYVVLLIFLDIFYSNFLFPFTLAEKFPVRAAIFIGASCELIPSS